MVKETISNDDVEESHQNIDIVPNHELFDGGMNFENSTVKAGSKRKSSAIRKSYTLADIKEAFVLYDDLISQNVKDLQLSITKELGIPQGTFAGWLKTRDAIQETIASTSDEKLTNYRGKGNCHHPFYPKEEEKLRDIIVERRANDLPCGGDFIRNTMNQFVAEANLAHPDKAKVFKASHNWLTRYCKRMNLPNKKGPIPGTTSRKNPRKTALPRDPTLGRKKRIIPLKMYDHAPFPGMPSSSSSSSSIAAVVAPHITLSSAFNADDDSSDDEGENLDSMHNIELLLMQPPSTSNVATTTTVTSGSSGVLSTTLSVPAPAPAPFEEEDALDACLNVIVSRQAAVNAANAKKLAASKRGKPKRVMANGVV